MKQILPALVATLLLSSCGNDAKVKHVEKNGDGTTTTTSYDMDKLKEMSASTDVVTKKIEELKKLSPLTLDQLKALLPEKLAGIKRTDYNTSSSMGYAVAEGEYKKDDNTSIKLMVYDCAGEAGSTMYTLTYWGAINVQQESEREYTKTIDFNGGKAIENYEKDRKKSTFTYVTNDRLLVVLTGRNMEPSALKDLAEDLDFDL